MLKNFYFAEFSAPTLTDEQKAEAIARLSTNLDVESVYAKQEGDAVHLIVFYRCIVLPSRFMLGLIVEGLLQVVDNPYQDTQEKLAECNQICEKLELPAVPDSEAVTEIELPGKTEE